MKPLASYRNALALTCLGFIVAIATSVPAQDQIPRIEIPAVSGTKVYTNVRIMSVSPQGVKVSHDSGVSVLPLSALPKEWQQKYGPDQAGNSGESPPSSSTPAPTSVKATDSPGTVGSSDFDPNCLVIIKTDVGVGSGFIASVGGTTYVYTNAHVICGSPSGFTSKIVSIKTASGKEISTPYELELSDTYDPNSSHGLEDVARFPIVRKAGEPAYAIGTLDAPTSMSQKVIAYGNSLGSDVITSLKGEILGLGTDRIEISCEIMPGNSGGPVVLADSNVVIGVSTYADARGKRDIWAKNTRFDKVRRFAVRPDKVTKWRKMQYTALMSSLAGLNGFQRDTLSLAAACYLNPKANRGGFDAPSTQKGDYVIREVLVEGSKHPLGATINAGIAGVNQRLGSAKATFSMAAAVPVFSGFFSSVAQASASQIASFQAMDRAPYLKQFVPSLIEERNEWHEAFVKEGVRRYR